MIRIRLALVLAGITLLAGLALWAGLPVIARAFAVLKPGGFLLVVLAHLPLVVLMGMAWWSAGAWPIGKPGRRAALRSFIVARLARDAVAELLPFSQVGGFAAGVRALSLTGVPAKAAGSSLFADLLMEFAAKLPYAAAGLGLLAWLRPDGEVPSYLVLTLLALAGIPLLLFFRGRLARLMPQFLRRWLGPFVETAGLDRFLVRQRLAPSGLLHLLCWGLGGLEAWLALRLMGVPITVLRAVAIDSLVTSLRTFGFFVPAALGVQEAAYVLVCGLFGLPPGLGVAFSLVRRARDLLFGLVGLGAWQQLEVKHAHRPISVPDLQAATEP